MSYQSLLAVFAHPDDEACAVGGTLAKYTRAGVDVSLICATRGEAAAPCCLPEPVTAEEMGRIRVAELQRSAHALGIKRTVVLGFPDGKLDAVDPGLLQRGLVRWINQLQPQVVITFGPDGHTGHPDHVAVGRAALMALRRTQEDASEGAVRLYYVLMPGAQPPHRAHAVIDVSAYADDQLQAMGCYQSQRGCWKSLLEQVGEDGLRQQHFLLAWSSYLPDYSLTGVSDLFVELM